ncbi:MAG: DUF4412 domain-containing protein [Candidatus Margulisiibacteriota bacterium]
MFRKMLSMVLFGIFLLSVSALALDYSAESVNVQIIGKEKEVIKGKAYVTKDKWRAETFTDEGEKTIAIFRYDKEVMWILIPAEKKYMEQNLSREQIIAAATELGKRLKEKIKAEFKFEKELLGAEKVSGILCNKYKTTTKIIEDGKTTWEYIVYHWVSRKYKELIMKTAFEDGSYNYLKNVKFGKQPAYLFEIPKGYTEMKMGVIRFGEEAEGEAEEEEIEEGERIKEEVEEEEEEIKREEMPKIEIPFDLPF